MKHCHPASSTGSSFRGTGAKTEEPRGRADVQTGGDPQRKATGLFQTGHYNCTFLRELLTDIRLSRGSFKIFVSGEIHLTNSPSKAFGKIYFCDANDHLLIYRPQNFTFGHF